MWIQQRLVRPSFIDHSNINLKSLLFDCLDCLLILHVFFAFLVFIFCNCYDTNSTCFVYILILWPKTRSTNFLSASRIEALKTGLTIQRVCSRHFVDITRFWRGFWCLQVCVLTATDRHPCVRQIGTLNVIRKCSRAINL